MILAHAEDEVQDRDEGADSIRISSQHDIAEADVVISRNVAGSDTGKR